MKKLTIVLSILGAVLGLRWLLSGSHSEDAPNATLIFDRVWIDRIPRGETDAINVLVALQDEEMGVFQRTSRWKGEHELFRHARGGSGKLRLLFPQTRDREEVGYRAVKCDRDGFDYCLELRGASRGARSYVSKKGWEVGSLGEAQAKLDQLQR